MKPMANLSLQLHPMHNDRYGIEIQTNIASLTLDSTGTSTNANVIETNQNNNFFGYAFANSNTPTL